MCISAGAAPGRMRAGEKFEPLSISIPPATLSLLLKFPVCCRRWHYLACISNNFIFAGRMKRYRANTTLTIFIAKSMGFQHQKYIIMRFSTIIYTSIVGFEF
jgi:hypothetical protein